MNTETPNWTRLEPLLDELLAMPPSEREARLQELHASAQQDAQTLREWLAGIADADSSLLPRAVLHDGLSVGAWRLLYLLGQGGMGEVWLCERTDGAFRMTAAIKFIRSNNPLLRKNLETERDLLAQLQHPNIARLLDGGTAGDGQPYMVTEYIDGVPLDVWCREQKPSLEQRLEVFRQICAAVSYAHANLIVHRDIKPANVLIDRQGQAHLLDFGISKLLQNSGDARQTTQFALTPDYAAPEQLTGAPITTRTDVYALGGLLYFLLCGKSPLPIRDLPLAAMLKRVCEDVPQAPSLMQKSAVASSSYCADLDAIVLKALAKSPKDRYGSADAILGDVENARSNRIILARRATPFDHLRRFVRRNRAAVALVSFAATAVVVGIIGIAWQARRAEVEAQTAASVRDFMVSVFQAADPQQSQGKVPSAIDLLDAGAQRANALQAGGPQTQAQLLGALGASYVGLGQYAKAIAVLRKGRDIAAVLGVSAPTTQRLSVALGAAVAEGSAPYPDVLPMLDEVIAADRTPEPGLHIKALLARARIAAKMGNADMARTLSSKAIIEARASNHADEIAVALATTGAILNLDNRQAEALPLLREALQIRQRDLPGTDLAVISVEQDLVAALIGTGDDADAQAHLQQIAQSQRAVLGDKHPAYASTLMALAELAQKEDQLAEAERYVRQALDIVESSQGADSGMLVSMLSALSILRSRQGDYPDALRIQRRSLDIAEKKYAALDWHVVEPRMRLAALDTQMGNYADADRVLSDLVAQCQRDSPCGGSHIALTSYLAATKLLRGDIAGAIALSNDALDRAQSESGKQNIFVISARQTLAAAQLRAGQLDAARRTIDMGLEGVAQIKNRNSRFVQRFVYLRAQLDYLQGHCERSQADLEAIWAQRKKSTAPSDQWSTAESGLLVGLCRRQLQSDRTDTDALIAANARTLIDSPSADPYFKSMARAALAAK